MDEVTLYGASYSVYVRIARATLGEKGVPFRLVEVDIFGDAEAKARHLARHPFGRIPAFRHGALELYETSAICRYVDEAFAGPPLQPSTAAARARMAQAISILDNYAYRTLVWDIYVERVARPAEGGVADEARIAAALPLARTTLAALDRLAPDAAWLAGADLTLADLHAAPMIAYFLEASEGRMLGDWPRLASWWRAISARPAVAATLGSIPEDRQ
ncbi:MAG: glutathione S-transferase family protein [Hyphomicrobiaceae bacterium]